MTRPSTLLLVLATCLVVTGCAGPVATPVSTETLAPIQRTATLKLSTPTSRVEASATATVTPMPTFSPASSSTPMIVVTLTPAAPAADPDAYRLKPWSAADDQERVAQMQALANWAAEHNPGYHDALAHGMERYIGVAELEAALHPADSADEDVIWDAVGHLARAGDQLATDWMARLIAQALNDGRVSLDGLSTWSRLEALSDGQPAQLQNVPALLGAGRDGWVLSVGQDHGAVLSIAREASGAWGVTTIASAWESAHESGLFVSVYDPPDGGTPEIWVEHMIQAGGGPTFAQYETHIYTWRREQWVDLSGGRLRSAGAESWAEPVPLEPGERSALELHTLLDPYQYPMCDWAIAYRLARSSDGYEYRGAEVSVPPEMTDPAELLCASNAWDWAVTEHHFESLVIWMKDARAHWPTPETDLGIPLGTVREAFGSGFPAFFDFQLGRFEALAGRVKEAEARLLDLVAQPSDPDRAQAQRLAALYLEALPDIAAAEAAVAPDLTIGQGVAWSPLPFQSTSATRSDWTLALQDVERLLFLDHQPAQALERLDGFEQPCIDVRAREPFDCARPLYLQGLASEWIGESTSALAAYWCVWQMYPDSPYAVLARLKLEPVLASREPARPWQGGSGADQTEERKP
ncbi:MAG: hypothetical protein JNL73_14800 [Anaerolineales bacterium]|nr:hypothetical protein [Anaerolineales bacterium]